MIVSGELKSRDENGNLHYMCWKCKESFNFKAMKFISTKDNCPKCDAQVKFNKKSEPPSCITVKVKEGYVVYNHDETEILYKVNDGDILTAELYKESDEYFAKDSQGRGVYVGFIDQDGVLCLDDDLELIG